jgi:3-oxoacyl-[acyl-carrier protein] reductase
MTMRHKNIYYFNPHTQKVALVTGGTGTLGSSVVNALCAHNWKVVFQYNDNEQKAKSLIRKLKTNKNIFVKACPLDLSRDPKNIEKVISSIEQEMKSIDAVVHCASIPFTQTKLTGESAACFDAMNALNVRAYLDIMSACLPGMKYRQKGVVIGILTEALIYRVPGWSAYVSSKAALASYLLDFAASVDLTGVRVVGILPGAFKIDAKKKATHAWPLQVQEAIKRYWPIGIESDKIADFIVDVIENQDRYANGSFWAVNAHEGIRDMGRFGFQPIQSKDSEKPIFKEADIDRTQDILHEQLSVIFKELFDLTSREEVEGAQLGVLSRWDSLKHIDVLMTVEERMKVKFSDSEISALISFKKILDSVRKLKAHASS